MALISASNLGKHYQAGELAVNALKNVSFDIEPAEKPRC